MLTVSDRTIGVESVGAVRFTHRHVDTEASLQTERETLQPRILLPRRTHMSDQ